MVNEKPAQLVQGRDLIPLGVRPGPEMGRILRAAYGAQIEGEFATCAEGLEWLKSHGLVKS